MWLTAHAIHAFWPKTDLILAVIMLTFRRTNTRYGREVQNAQIFQVYFTGDYPGFSNRTRNDRHSDQQGKEAGTQ